MESRILRSAPLAADARGSLPANFMKLANLAEDSIKFFFYLSEATECERVPMLSRSTVRALPTQYQRGKRFHSRVLLSCFNRKCSLYPTY